jgi:hypothetical protein
MVDITFIVHRLWFDFIMDIFFLRVSFVFIVSKHAISQVQYSSSGDMIEINAHFAGAGIVDSV